VSDPQAGRAATFPSLDAPGRDSMRWDGDHGDRASASKSTTPWRNRSSATPRRSTRPWCWSGTNALPRTACRGGLAYGSPGLTGRDSASHRIAWGRIDPAVREPHPEGDAPLSRPVPDPRGGALTGCTPGETTSVANRLPDAQMREDSPSTCKAPEGTSGVAAERRRGAHGGVVRGSVAEHPDDPEPGPVRGVPHRGGPAGLHPPGAGLPPLRPQVPCPAPPGRTAGLRRPAVFGPPIAPGLSRRQRARPADRRSVTPPAVVLIGRLLINIDMNKSIE
jgi:hypothetical protein